MNQRWLYCFQCGSSHYFVQTTFDSWQCPNCHAVRHYLPVPGDEPDEDEPKIKHIQCTVCGKWFYLELDCTGTYTRKCFDCLKKQENQ